MTKMTAGTDTRSTIYEYDHFGRLTKLTDAMGQSETYAYDSNGNLTEKRDRNGTTFSYTYDGMNRQLNVTAQYSNGGTAPEFIKYTYAKTGALLAEQNESMTVTNTYDSLGRLIKQLEGSIEKNYTYDAAGNRKSFTVKNGGSAAITTTYDYDNMNRLWKVYEGSTLRATYAYDQNGNRASLKYANGVTVSYTYNKANLVTSLTNQNSSGTTLSGYTYSYYLDGNQSKKTDSDGCVTTYTYDDLGRLTQETDSYTGTISYTYDSAGNRESMTVSQDGKVSVTVYEYDLNNRLISDTTYTGDEKAVNDYFYDANGNQISKPGSMTVPPVDPDIPPPLRVFSSAARLLSEMPSGSVHL